MNEVTPAPERWLSVPTWEGYYEVSDYGFVRSLPREVKTRGTGTRLNPGRVLRPSYSNSGGYPLVILTLGDRKEGRYVHDLVTLVFIGERKDGEEVRHLDGNARSASLWAADGSQRLAYGTSGENKRDQIRHGTHYEGSRDCCDAGHEFTPENTRVDRRPDGSFKQRMCRACANDRTKERRRNLAQSDKRCTSEEGCDDPVWAKDLCEMHYARQWRAAKKARDQGLDVA